MTRRLTMEEKARISEAAHAAERARRPDAAAIAIYVDNSADEDGTVGYHAVIRIDARLRWDETP